MYTLQPVVQPKKLQKRTSWWIVPLVFVIASVFAVALRISWSPAENNQVALVAKEWNNGKVHVWKSLQEGSDQFVDVPASTICTRLDDNLYKLGSGDTTLYYYKLSCNGTVGYVETDQVY